MPFLLLLPSIAGILLVIGYPFVAGLWYSLSNGTLLRSGTFVGLQNYITMLGAPDTQHAFVFSAIFSAANVAGCYLLGLGLALLLNLDIPGRGIFRVALLLPWIIPSVVSIVSWRWLIDDQNAPLNRLLGAFGAGPIYFLSTESWAVFTVVVIKIWRAFPFMMLSLLAALQAIDHTLYEAAGLDGASPWQSFRHVTMPQLKNISIVLCILMTIWTVNDFETPWLLTEGGPSGATENLVLIAYKYTFVRNRLGGGAAISFVTLLILAVLAMWLMRAQREEN